MQFFKQQKMQFWQKWNLTENFGQHAKTRPQQHLASNQTLRRKSVYLDQESLALNLTFKAFGFIFWSTLKLVHIITASKSAIQVLPTKMIQPTKSEACDFVLHSTSFIAHFPGKLDTAAGYPSGLETDPSKKVFLEIREKVLTQPIEVNIESTGLAQEDQVFSTTMTLTCDLKIWQGKQEKRSKIRTEPPVITLSHCHKNYKYTDTLGHNIELFTKVPHTLTEQDADSVPLTFKKNCSGNISTNKPLIKTLVTLTKIKNGYSKQTISCTGGTTTKLPKINHPKVLILEHKSDTLRNSIRSESGSWMQKLIEKKLLSINSKLPLQMGRKMLNLHQRQTKWQVTNTPGTTSISE